MAFKGAIYIPNKGMDLLSKNLTERLLYPERNDIRSKIARDVLKMDISTLKSFYLINLFCGFNIGNDMEMMKYPNVVSDLTTKMLNVDYDINEAIIKNFDNDLYVALSNKITEIGISKDEIYNRELGDIAYNNIGIFLSYLVNLLPKRVLDTVIIDSYKVPFTGYSIMELVYDVDNYEKFINTMIKIVMDYFNLTLKDIKSSGMRTAIHKPIDLYGKDIVKNYISKEPDIGYVVLNNDLAKANKSFLISVG